jgi:hypothetical protein
MKTYLKATLSLSAMVVAAWGGCADARRLLVVSAASGASPLLLPSGVGASAAAGG